MICSPFLVLAAVPYPTAAIPLHNDSPPSSTTTTTMEGSAIVALSVDALVSLLSTSSADTLVLDCRPFMSFNTGHVVHSVNVHCPPILKRRSGGFVALENIVPEDEPRDRLLQGGYRSVVVYDQSTYDLALADRDSNLYAVVKSLMQQVDLDTVYYLAGGYDAFSQDCPLLCATQQFSVLSSSRHETQPSLPDDHPVEIRPGLFLGNEAHSANRELLERLGVTALVNVSTVCRNHFPDHFRYLHIPVNDSASEDLSRWFSVANTFIDQVMSSREGKVLVHCHAGRSRSATVCIAYLMTTLRMSLDAAFEHVRARRQVVDPNLNFMQQLQTYSQRLEQEWAQHEQQQEEAMVTESSDFTNLEEADNASSSSTLVSYSSSPSSLVLSVPANDCCPSSSATTSCSSSSSFYSPSTSPSTAVLSVPTSGCCPVLDSSSRSPRAPRKALAPISLPSCLPMESAGLLAVPPVNSMSDMMRAPPSPLLPPLLSPVLAADAVSPLLPPLPPSSSASSTSVPDVLLPPPSPSPATPSKVQCFFTFSTSELSFNHHHHHHPHHHPRTPEIQQPS